MSTRATYQFITNPVSHQPRVTFYIHHDGFPEGAAQYLAAAMPLVSGGMAERFVRANQNAEFTSSHETHGDTDYRYTLDGTFLRAEKRNTEDGKWRGIFAGELVDFVQLHSGAKFMHWYGQFMLEDAAKEQLTAKLLQVDHWLDRGATGNAGSAATEAWKFCQAVIKRFGRIEATEDAEKRIAAADRKLCVAFGWPEQLKVSEDEAFGRWVASHRKVES